MCLNEANNPFSNEVGDIHGCADELLELATKVAPPNSTFIAVGDVVNKGPKSGDSVRLMKELGKLALIDNLDIGRRI